MLNGEELLELSFQHAEVYEQEERCTETGSGTRKGVKSSHNIQNNNGNMSGPQPDLVCVCVNVFINDSLCKQHIIHSDAR